MVKSLLSVSNVQVPFAGSGWQGYSMNIAAIQICCGEGTHNRTGTCVDRDKIIANGYISRCIVGTRYRNGDSSNI